MQELRECFKGKRVFVTGHTGFKGAWLTLFLESLGAHVFGYSLGPVTEPNLFTLLHMEERIHDVRGDIRDFEALQKAISSCKPDLIFHLAAQSLVSEGYKKPKETFEVNTLGTVNLLEALRQNEEAVEAVVIVTTDKVYENRQWIFGYRENDVLGGEDPYSASKSMAEQAAAAYRSLCPHFPIATVRAGNIIGGGDFSKNRLVPDTMSALMRGDPVVVRNPESVRPWLHVLDPLRGYLHVAAFMMQGEDAATAWNFGPLEQRAVTCQEVVERAIALWGSGSWEKSHGSKQFHEMGLLRLNWDKAASSLNWQPRYNIDEALAKTVEWYKCYKEGGSLYDCCLSQIADHSHLEVTPCS